MLENKNIIYKILDYLEKEYDKHGLFHYFVIILIIGGFILIVISGSDGCRRGCYEDIYGNETCYEDPRN